MLSQKIPQDLSEWYLPAAGIAKSIQADLDSVSTLLEQAPFEFPEPDRDISSFLLTPSIESIGEPTTTKYQLELTNAHAKLGKRIRAAYRAANHVIEYRSNNNIQHNAKDCILEDENAPPFDYCFWCLHGIIIHHFEEYEAWTKTILTSIKIALDDYKKTQNKFQSGNDDNINNKNIKSNNNTSNNNTNINNSIKEDTNHINNTNVTQSTATTTTRESTLPSPSTSLQPAASVDVDSNQRIKNNIEHDHNYQQLEAQSKLYQSNIKQLEEENNKLQHEINQLQYQQQVNNKLNQDLTSTRQQLHNAQQTIQQQIQQITNGQNEINDLRQKLDEMSRKYQEIESYARALPHKVPRHGNNIVQNNNNNNAPLLAKPNPYQSTYKKPTYTGPGAEMLPQNNNTNTLARNSLNAAASNYPGQQQLTNNYNNNGTPNNTNNMNANQSAQTKPPSSVGANDGTGPKFIGPIQLDPDGTLPEPLKEFKLEHVQELIGSFDLVDPLSPKVSQWDRVAGLRHCKNAIEEGLIFPLLRPDLFKEALPPASQFLLFGPPGTGKTMLAKAIASECNINFCNIKTANLTSKWFGDGEKLVQTLFALCYYFRPCILFVDEADSLLTTRQTGEHDGARRIKNTFLTETGIIPDKNQALSLEKNKLTHQNQFGYDGGGGSGGGDNYQNTSSLLQHDDFELGVIFIAATNLPSEIDEAVLRRFNKILYVPLPGFEARKAILTSRLTKHQNHLITDEHIAQIAKWTKGYSGSDISRVYEEAAHEPLRFTKREISNVAKDRTEFQILFKQAVIPPLSFDNFKAILGKLEGTEHVGRNVVCSTANQETIDALYEFNTKRGSFLIPKHDDEPDEDGTK